jgi:iron complex outermembrane receptor protein
MRKLSKISLAILSATSLNYAASAYAAEVAAAPAEDDVEVIQVTGIRSSLTAALATKRDANNLVEVVEAVDIGKLPDQNLAEVLENVTGIQITREAGVGTGVQIRGTDSNRIQINGVSTVGAGNDRTGMSFEDIDASIISGLEIIKSPEAKTTEGSVGGTINLKTIRPLQLSETLASVRVQAEKSSLSTDSATPRLSGAYGDTWITDAGEFGFVISGSYTESDNSAFRPRLDRDNLTTCSNGSTTCDNAPAGTTHFLGVQFLNQVQVNQEYETTNIAGSFEYAPNDDVKFYFDAVLNDQERRQESSRVQFSNVSQLNGQSDGDDGLWSTFTDFETYDLGDLAGRDGNQDLGSIVAVTGGTFSPQQGNADGGRGAPFMRVSMDSGARTTDTQLFRLGSEFTVNDDLSGSVEVSTTKSETVNPNLSLTLNFINPNSLTAPSGSDFRDENGTPVIFDLSDGIAFGINFDDQYAPTQEQLLDPANYVMDSGGTYSANERENKEDTFRTDFTYYVDDIEAITSIDFGYRYNKRTSLRDNISASAGGTSGLSNSLRGNFVADLLTEIPDNFGDGTGKELFVNGVLQFDPEAAVNAEEFVAAINAGITTAGISQSPISTNLASSQSAYFDIEEVSNALYAQVNFEYGIFRGNAGLRYVKTDFDSVSFENDYVDANTTNLVQVNGSSSNSFVLPRISIVADLHDDVLLRASYSEDINRPDFEHMTAARTMPNRGGVNDVSRVGNADLEPEEIESFDISLEWYFAPASIVSVGYFEKTRSNLFGQTIEQPGDINGLREQQDIFNRDGPDVGGSDDGAPCLLGGVFSEDTDAGIFRNTDLANRGSDNGRGVCVGNATRFNASGETKQSGFEFSFQYSLAEFEEDLGWASGFGVIANYTIQDADVNTGFIDIGETRAQAIYEAQGFDRVTNPVSREAASLLNLSEDAYNFTVFYEKYGLTARARYTYRSAYQTDNLPGTSNEFDPMGTRAVVEARGQLNASVSYNVNENLVFSVDAVNLTESDQDISCISEGGILCYKGITDRRVIAGVSYKF